jgi:glycosyltransferase involved in cell wall biosynthesis
MIFRPVFAVARLLVALLAMPALILAAVLPGRRRASLVWGPVPIINNKYWSRALREGGRESVTLVSEVYAINRREDFDLLFDDLLPGWVKPSVVRRAVVRYVAACWVLRRARVVHMPFSGGPLGTTPLWRLESFLLRAAGTRSVVLPYGADVYAYSHVVDPVQRHGLLLSYPQAGRTEGHISERIDYWCSHADTVVMGFTLDGVGRWDVPVGNMVTLNLEEWSAPPERSAHDGAGGVVRILHTPNHRGVKGTEFLIKAVDDLRAQGLQVELVLAEQRTNDQVRELMQQTDILADQLLLSGYGLAAIEGMAVGLPVICNLEDRRATRLFRLYSFLGDCPVVSSTPETVTETLRTLVTRPELRRRLGAAGRVYVERYHSYEAARYLFGAIYSRIVDGADVDLMNLFHPLKSDYMRQAPRIDHGLIEHHLG